MDCSIPLKGASRVILPKEHWVSGHQFHKVNLYISALCCQDVANAVGAALGTVGGSSDLVVNLEPIKAMLKEEKEGEGYGDAELEQKAREVALNRGKEAARNEAITKKGKTHTPYPQHHSYIFIHIRN